MISSHTGSEPIGLDAGLTVAVDCVNHHGEGVLWNDLDGQLWWTDIEGRTLWSFDPRSERFNQYPMRERVCCFAPRTAGGFVLGVASGFVLRHPLTQQWDVLASFESALPQTRLNDGRTDRQGRFVAGGMDERNGEAVSSVCRLETDLSVTPLFDAVACANSICFSPDGRTMYFADSPSGRIDAFDYDADGTQPPHKSRTLASLDIAHGVPDGSCVDAHGYLWNAVWAGGRVERRAPDGRLDRVIHLPVAKPTCCAFGGAALDTLYITTSRLHSTPEQLADEPLAGALFAIRPGVSGLADLPFTG
jgi:L-arabinonolactonase